MTDYIPSTYISYKSISKMKTIYKNKRNKIFKALYKDQVVCMKLNSSYDEFKHELDILSFLQGHPNIIKLYGYTICMEKHYIVMEYCEKGDLASNLSFNTSDDQKIKWSLDIIGVLKWICEHGIVYGDLKLENIGLSADNEIKLLDFEFSDTELNKSKGQTRGTLGFIDPEILFGEVKWTFKGDIYSFGMTLYSLFENEIPFSSYTDEEIEELIAKGRRVNIDNLPPKIQNIITMCCFSDVRYTLNEIETKLLNYK
jgi:serine/threonine protein kinase